MLVGDIAAFGNTITQKLQNVQSWNLWVHLQISGRRICYIYSWVQYLSSSLSVLKQWRCWQDICIMIQASDKWARPAGSICIIYCILVCTDLFLYLIIQLLNELSGWTKSLYLLKSVHSTGTNNGGMLIQRWMVEANYLLCLLVVQRIIWSDNIHLFRLFFVDFVHFLHVVKHYWESWVNDQMISYMLYIV